LAFVEVTNKDVMAPFLSHEVDLGQNNPLFT